MPLVSFDAPLKTAENLWFFDVFWGIEKDQWHEMAFNEYINPSLQLSIKLQFGRVSVMVTMVTNDFLQLSSAMIRIVFQVIKSRS